MSKSIKKVLKSSTRATQLVSVGAAVNTEQTNKVEAVEGGADMKDIAVSSATVIDAQLQAFADKLSDQTLSDIDIGIEATETKQRNPLDIMFDIQADFKGDLEALMNSYPEPYSDAPKNMTPATWGKDKNNSNRPWPYDKWSERVSQAQGGKRNVNYVWFKEAYLKTKRGVAHADALKATQDQIVLWNSEKPLTGDFQKMELDELQAMEKKLARRITTAGDNLRDAVALVRQFVAFAPFKEKIAFSVLLETDEDGNQMPTASRLPIRVQAVSVVQQGNEKIVERMNKKPVSIDTFLNYNVDRFATLLKVPGKSAYDALLESKPQDNDQEKETATSIKLPIATDEKLFDVVGLIASYLSDDSAMSRIIKKLGERDATGAPKNAAEVRSFLDLHVATLPIHVAFRGWYDQINLSSDGSKLIKKTN